LVDEGVEVAVFAKFLVVFGFVATLGLETALFPKAAVLVVLGAFVGVGENFVSFPDVLEFFLGFFVPWIHVRVIFSRHLAIGEFDVGSGGVSGNSQNGVVVSEVLHGLGGGVKHGILTLDLGERIKQTKAAIATRLRRPTRRRCSDRVEETDGDWFDRLDRFDPCDRFDPSAR
jgi:hypothetical protein